MHPFLGQRASVLAHLLADLAEARIDRLIVDIRCLAVQHAARAVLRAERGVFGIIWVLRLLLGIQVVKIAVELIEAVNRGQKLIAVAEMVLAELLLTVSMPLSVAQH